MEKEGRHTTITILCRINEKESLWSTTEKSVTALEIGDIPFGALKSNRNNVTNWNYAVIWNSVRGGRRFESSLPDQVSQKEAVFKMAASFFDLLTLNAHDLDREFSSRLAYCSRISHKIRDQITDA